MSGSTEDDTHARDECASTIEAVVAGVHDPPFDVEDLVAGDEVIVADFTLSATHVGSFMGVPTTARRAEIAVVDEVRVADGQMVELRSHLDPNELTEQLGLYFQSVLWQLPKLLWRKICGQPTFNIPYQGRSFLTSIFGSVTRIFGNVTPN